ncbi:MAG: rubredoxin [Siculibacillus sp.]|nr:rubredoxin [Siculibacillus sp.]
MFVATRRAVLALLALLPFGSRTRAAEPQRWLCTYNECLPYVYDPAHGDPDNIAGTHPIPPGVAFEDLPADWRCPVCGSPKEWFEETDAPWRGTG